MLIAPAIWPALNSSDFLISTSFANPLLFKFMSSCVEIFLPPFFESEEKKRPIKITSGMERNHCSYKNEKKSN